MSGRSASPTIAETLQAVPGPWPDDLAARLTAFASLFLQWNERINLSAARTPAELDEHIADCLHVVPYVRGSARLVDVGSGGGLPSLVLALALPATHVTALEPVHKKHAFLRTAARALGLPNFVALAERDEVHAATYNVATSRATFDLDEWLTRGARFAPRVLAMEGQRRETLPKGSARYPYAFGAKERAIIVWTAERPSQGVDS